MLALNPAIRYFLFREHTDMRKSFDGLSGLVRSCLGENPTNGDVFIFINRRRNQVKLLLFEGDGFAIYHKRLERGTYELPETDGNKLIMRHDALQLILNGVSLKSVHKRKRFALRNDVALAQENTLHT